MEDMGFCAGELTCIVSKGLFLESSSAFTLAQLVVLTFNKGKKQKNKKKTVFEWLSITLQIQGSVFFNQSEVGIWVIEVSLGLKVLPLPPLPKYNDHLICWKRYYMSNGKAHMGRQKWLRVPLSPVFHLIF